MATDLWARCGECDRWFFVEQAVKAQPACPVCGLGPVETSDRAVDERHTDVTS